MVRKSHIKLSYLRRGEREILHVIFNFLRDNQLVMQSDFYLNNSLNELLIICALKVILR